MISKYTTVFFPYTTIIPYHFLYGHRLFHLDNPDPVETETISNPNPKNSQSPAESGSKIWILYTTDVLSPKVRVPSCGKHCSLSREIRQVDF